jgi:chemotaxis response regulator CheB
MRGTHGLTVLLVDASVVVRRVLIRLLRKHRQIERLFEAGGGAEGYSLFNVCRPDIVILDLDLPDLHGLVLARMIKDALPVCFVIGLTNPGKVYLRDQRLLLEVDKLLTKEPGLAAVVQAVVEAPLPRRSAANRIKPAPDTTRRTEEFP